MFAIPKPIKKRRDLFSGVAHVHSTFNNTIITISDEKGNTLYWCSGGLAGFKGARRSTSFAAQSAAEQAGRKAFEAGLLSISVVLKGIGDGRESAIRGLQSSGLKITSISDETPVPHNGCRPKKQRRV
uniref:Small ribosomal subunit protein uS11c n=1 Tax=Andalucia godoyi TaxID=505711 RepID=M4QCR5_ANDGO|nr:ribosomal protein S11 [Andalucia godoyi]AGH23990.1 ribosomal protein S11 [Andalucia godoyi]